MTTAVDNEAAKDIVAFDKTRLVFGGFQDVSTRYECCDDMSVAEVVKYFWVQLLVMPMVLFLGVWTNVAMFLTFHKKKYYSVHNFLLKTMAIVNILNLIFVVPLLFVMPFLTGLKVSALCKAASFVASVGITTVAACMVLTAVNSFLNAQHALFQLSKQLALEVVAIFFVMFCIINGASVWVMKARQVQVFFAAQGEKPARIIGMMMCLPSDNYFRYPSDIVYTFLLGMMTYTMLFLIIYFYMKAANLMAEEENLEVEVEFVEGIDEKDEEEEVMRQLNEKMIDDVTTVHFTMIIYMLFFVSMAPYYFITWRATSRTQRDLKLSSLFKIVFDIGMLLPMIFTVIQPAVQIFLTICGTDDSDTHVKELTEAVLTFPDRKLHPPPYVQSLFHKRSPTTKKHKKKHKKPASDMEEEEEQQREKKPKGKESKKTLPPTSQESFISKGEEEGGKKAEAGESLEGEGGDSTTRSAATLE